MNVHNHGTEDGPGLACREVRLPDGRLRGACLDVEAGHDRPGERRWLCRFGLHRWTRSLVPVQAWGGIRFGYARRQCERCHKTRPR